MNFAKCFRASMLRELPSDCLWDLNLQSQLETPTERCNASNFVGVCGFLQNV